MTRYFETSFSGRD